MRYSIHMTRYFVSADRSRVPPNVKFEVDDVESPWISKKFDFIFCRAMAGAIQDWPKLVRSMFEYVFNIDYVLSASSSD